MIKIDYLIRRDEGDRIAEFKPKLIPTELPNVVYIEGPNSSGKSTLLNLIALAFFGQKLSSDELNQDLRERLNNLINSPHQDIKFKIQVDNELMGIELISEKEDLDAPDFTVRIRKGKKEKPISADAFRKEYKLIYDIPNNPLERLPLLLMGIKNDQKDLELDIGQLRDYLRSVIEEIKNSKDPDLIEKLRNKNEIDESHLTTNNTALEELNKKKNQFKQYFLARFYGEYKTEKEQISERIEEITKRAKKEKRDLTQAIRKNQALYKQLEENLQNLENNFREIKGLLPNIIDKDQKQSYEYWAKGNIRNEVFYPDIYSMLREVSKFFSEYLKDKHLSEQQSFSQDLDKINMLKSLIAILNDYRNKKFTIPNVNLPISDFIDSLNEDLSNHQELIIKLQNIDHCAKLLDKLILTINDTIKISKELNNKEKILNIEDIEEFSSHQELTDLLIQLTDISDKENKYKTSIIKANWEPEKFLDEYATLKTNPELEVYNTFIESQLKDKLNEMENKIKDKEKVIAQFIKRIESTNNEILRLEEKEPHKYQDYYSTIQEILAHVLNLEKEFHSFDIYIKKIIAGNVKFNEFTDEEKSYSEFIGTYLAKKVISIRHISEVYDVKNINVIQKKITTEQGKEIQFTDLGTGQGQAAYLDTLLSMSENKKIIALFDEVAMMDESSLKPIKKKLRKLYEKGNLLMAIIVQKGEKVKVEPIV